MRKTTVLFVMLAVLAAGLVACDSQVGDLPLPPIEGNLNKWGLNANLAMFTLVRDALSKYPDVRRILEMPEDPDLPDVRDRPVIVSLLKENAPPVWGVGRQGAIREAILRAVYQITQDENFVRYYLLDPSKIAVRIDILYSRDKLNVSDLSKVILEPGIHGLILQNGEQQTYQPPFAYIYYGWEEKFSNKNLRRRRVESQLNYLAEAANVSSWKDYPIYRFRTLSFLQHREDFLPLRVFRDAPLIQKFGSREIGRAAIDAGRYLNRTFNPTTQHFQYFFNPITLEKAGFLDYDTVAHAGTVYGMVRLYKASQKDEFFEVTQKATDFLMQRLEPPLLEPEQLCVKRNYVAQLGASALTLIALCDLPEKLLQHIGISRINSVARFIVEMQEPTGRFYNYDWQRLIGFMPKTPNRQFAGESLLALVRYYKVNPNVEWLQAARLAANRLIADYRTSGKPDLWAIQGLAELHEVDPQPEYAEICFAMTDEVIKHQYGSPLSAKKMPYPDYRGGYDNTRPPRTLQTANSLEAMVAAHKLAYQLNRDTKVYQEAIMAATLFLMQNQYRRDNIYYTKLPDEIHGALRGGLVDPSIRMNDCQHAIVALTGAYDVAYMRETGEVPTEFAAEGTKALVDDLAPNEKLEDSQEVDELFE